LLVSIVALLSVSLPAAAAQSEAQISIVASNAQVTVGELVTVSVFIDDVDQLAGMDLRLSYDPDQMELVPSTLTSGTNFSSFGGEDIDEAEGIITFPVLYGKPQDKGITGVQVMTVSFQAKRHGPAVFSVEGLQVVNNVSKEIAVRQPDPVLVATGQVLDTVDGENSFTIRSVWRYLDKAGSQLLDWNGDGHSDKKDVEYLLRGIQPVSQTK